MSLLEHPTAQALLADAEVSAGDVRGCRRRLDGVPHRYLPRFYREEQRELARVVLQGKLSNLERKTSEPIAYLAGLQRKPVQHFVGAGAWDDEAAKGYAPLDRRLYLPREWAGDDERREETHVPEAVTFQEAWRIGLDLLDRSGPDVPFGWVAGDDEFGRASAFRAALRERGLRYVLAVPSNTSLRI